MPVNFQDLAYDVIGGTALGGIGGIVEYTVAGAVGSLPGAFISAGTVTPLAVITGALIFGGAILAHTGSAIHKANSG